jgi:2-iminobutanoate/2-iminopropanoate deaminase
LTPVGVGVADHTRQILKNIQIVLRAAGCSKPSGGLSNIIKANVFLTDMKDFSALNGAWVEVLTAAQKEDGLIGEGQEAVMPARTCVQVAALPFGTDVSLQCPLAFGGMRGDQWTLTQLPSMLR